MEQKELLIKLQALEASIFEKLSIVRQSPEELRSLIGNFASLGIGEDSPIWVNH